ncbi:MAG: hypothetical protein DMF69_19590 [Acidobacteria bacterium]|nr:MAG: hypothetical protein DMF69_19590 [Acidobacteriota bacterium]
MSKKTSNRSDKGFRSQSSSSTRNLLKRILRLLPGILFAVLTVFLFSRVSMLHKVQNLVIDARMKLNEAPNQSEVAIVEISDDDYRQLFDAIRPLDPTKLRSLISAIALCRPKLIAIDIDTSSDKYKALTIDRRWPPIVWERESKETPGNVDEVIEPLSVLGEQDALFDSNSGFPFLIEDSEDKVTRRYRRSVNTTNGILPTFTSVIIARAGNEKTRSFQLSAPDEFFIRYSADRDGSRRTVMNASQVVELAKAGHVASDNVLRDKIVLVGGTYLGEDRHETPLGVLNGVEILGQVVETELQGGGDRSPTRLTTSVLEIFEAILVVILFQLFRRYSFITAVLINAGVVLLVALVCSLTTFRSVFHLTYFLPILVIVLLFEFVFEYRSHIVMGWRKQLPAE